MLVEFIAGCKLPAAEETRNFNGVGEGLGLLYRGCRGMRGVGGMQFGVARLPELEVRSGGGRCSSRGFGFALFGLGLFGLGRRRGCGWRRRCLQDVLGDVTFFVPVCEAQALDGIGGKGKLFSFRGCVVDGYENAGVDVRSGDGFRRDRELLHLLVYCECLFGFVDAGEFGETVPPGFVCSAVAHQEDTEDGGFASAFGCGGGCELEDAFGEEVFVDGGLEVAEEEELRGWGVDHVADAIIREMRGRWMCEAASERNL